MSLSASSSSLHGFRPVPRTGVIYVMTEAERHGFGRERAQWANLGQGAPETSALPGAPPRLTSIELCLENVEYAPVVGLDALRDAVARLYNERYRRGLASQYTREHVAICGGGRLALTRVVSTLGPTHVGHFLPDYTAYEELLETFGTFVPIPILGDPERAYELDAEGLEREILGRGLSVVLLSNPCNPTGRHIAGERLRAWLDVARALDCALILDEFYSHYVYAQGGAPASAARYVADVDRDPVLLLDGLTKNWRYPGLRVAWTVGPPALIERIASAGSFLDGGCAQPIQQAILPLVEPEHADREARAIQAAFAPKRARLLAGLRALGIVVEPEPAGGFYCWGDLRALPERCASGMRFFRRALEEKVVVVPGAFFDINPGKRRPDRGGRFEHFARFSFGPPLAELERGLAALQRVVS